MEFESTMPQGYEPQPPYSIGQFETGNDSDGKLLTKSYSSLPEAINARGALSESTEFEYAIYDRLLYEVVTD
jgi:hypothetical protein